MLRPRLPSLLSCLDRRARGRALSILIVESTYRDEDRALSPHRGAGGGVARRLPRDAVRLRKPRPAPLGAGSRPAQGAALLPRGSRAAARTEGSAARSGAGCRARTALGRPGPRIGHHVDSRRTVLLSRPRRSGARRNREPRGSGRRALERRRARATATVRAAVRLVGPSARAAPEAREG